jgi:hypothetical protein
MANMASRAAMVVSNRAVMAVSNREGMAVARVVMVASRVARKDMAEEKNVVKDTTTTITKKVVLVEETLLRAVMAVSNRKGMAVSNREGMAVARVVMVASRAAREDMAEEKSVVRDTTNKVVLVEETLLRAASKILHRLVISCLHLLTMSSYGGGGGYGGGGNDFSGAMQHAEQHGGDSADSSMFSNVLGRLGQNQQNIGNQGIDEQRTRYPRVTVLP